MSLGLGLIQRRAQLRIYLNEEKDYELRFKLSLLNLVIELQNVEKACKLMAISVPTGALFHFPVIFKN